MKHLGRDGAVKRRGRWPRGRGLLDARIFLFFLQPITYNSGLGGWFIMNNTRDVTITFFFGAGLCNAPKTKINTSTMSRFEKATPNSHKKKQKKHKPLCPLCQDFFRQRRIMFLRSSGCYNNFATAKAVPARRPPLLRLVYDTRQTSRGWWWLWRWKITIYRMTWISGHWISSESERSNEAADMKLCFNIDY